jgi:aminopeptidase C
MKKILTLLVMSVFTLAAIAQKAPAKKVFTIVKANPITSVKNQNRSGTCWDYATIGFLESEILRKTGKTYDLCEMFVAHNDYVDCAEYHVRMHGDSRFSQGGSCDDVISVIRRHGICPEEAMTKPGTLVGDTLANFNEFFAENHRDEQRQYYCRCGAKRDVAKQPRAGEVEILQIMEQIVKHLLIT